MMNDFYRFSRGRIPRTLAEVGLKQKDLAGIAESLSNLPYTESEMLPLILENALYGRPRAFDNSAHPEIGIFGRDGGARKILPEAYV
jgi:hypothetical protein